MLVIKEKGKPKQGRIQRGFVKGGGRSDTSPLQNETLSWNCFFLSKRDATLKLQLPQSVARTRAYAIWLVFEKFTSADLSQNCTRRIMWLPILTSQYSG